MRKRQRFIQFVMAVSAGLALIGLAIPGLVWAVDLLANGQFEQFQSYNNEEWRGFAESYGAGWNVRVINGEDDLHLMDSDTYGRFLAAIFGLPYQNYHLEGDRAQVGVSRRAYNFVLSQTVTTQPGENYTFGGKVVSFWKGPGPEVDHTRIFKRIGLDPTGGAAYDATSVIWTDWDGLDNVWTSPALAATAQGSQVTVFIQVDNTAADVGPTDLNVTYIDSFWFELAPGVNLNLPDSAPPGPVSVSWNATIPDPGFWSLWGYDAQFKDEATGTWQTVQTHDGANGGDESYSFAGQAGQTYAFRVRAWQQEGPGGNTTIPALPGVWVEKSVTINNQAATGRVINHAGLPLAGVTVTANGVLTPAVSQPNGYYQIPTGSDGAFEIKAQDYQALVAPPTATVTATTAISGYLDITLRPGGAQQAILNNDFEIDGAFWQSDAGPVSLATGEAHTGQQSLHLSGSSAVSQTGSIANMYDPLLSFWYKSDQAFTVQLLGTADLTPMLEMEAGPAGEWTHFILEWDQDQVYSGNIGTRFIAAGGNIFIDEVSIGAGLRQAYLPVIVREN